MISHFIALAFVLFVAAAVFGLGWQCHKYITELRQPPAPDPEPPPLPSTMTRALPRAGRLPLHRLPETGPSGPWLSYGPFPVDTGPLLILSEQAAARIALERDIEAMCAEAEAKIPPRWR